MAQAKKDHLQSSCGAHARSNLEVDRVRELCIDSVDDGRQLGLDLACLLDLDTIASADANLKCATSRKAQ